MEVILQGKKDIVFRAEETIDTDKVTINQVTDNYTSVIALVSIGEKTKEIIVWEGTEYEALGQWTDTDLTNKLKQLL